MGLLARGTPAWIVLPWLAMPVFWLAARLYLPLLVVPALLSLLLALFLLFFFRDPDRDFAQGLVCPADGVVMEANVTDGLLRLVIFMNPFNVHVNRSPLASTVISQTHHPGKFVPAYKGEASTNERLVTLLETDLGQVKMAQVAGYLVRRIVSYVEPGQKLAAGERLGLVRFGSRVELELLAEGVELLVAIGEKVLAGSTSLARLPLPLKEQ